MKNNAIILLTLTAALAASCVDEDGAMGQHHSDDASPLVIYATISGSGSAMTRAALLEIHDMWSYADFENGDVMGFYSPSGDWTENGGKGGFDNLPLKYDAEKKQFNDTTNGVEFSPSNMDGSKIFMYFPYEEDMNGIGMELRRRPKNKAGTDDGTAPFRCVDFLSSNSISLQGVVNGKDVALYGAFTHAFSELIIMRGVGFDNPPEGMEQITAVLDNGYTHVRLEISKDDEGNVTGYTPQLTYSDGKDTGTETEEDANDRDSARRWEAWSGGNFAITDSNKVGVPAWYVIVPTLPGQRSTVEYIELYDNDGELKRVTSLILSNNTKQVDPGWRYPMEITLKEQVPTVNPYRIVPWGQNTDLTDARKRGITDATDFAQWALDYNLYLVNPATEEANKIEALLKYGDMFIDAQTMQRSWHFYVLSDLDLSQYMPLPDTSGRDSAEDGSEGGNGIGGEGEGTTASPKLPYIIPTLKDTLDGISTTLKDGKFINHSITGLSQTFIDKMSDNGSLQNFDFIKPKVIKEASETPAGIIANTMTGNGTSVVNCTIVDGDMYNPEGPAGMVAGEMTDGGKVENCTLGGFLIAKEIATGDAYKIVGKTGGSPRFSNNNVADVLTGPRKE